MPQSPDRSRGGVLNLANEYVPTVITETFTVSLLTAVLLKVVLEGVVWVKDRLKGRFKAATTTVRKILAGVGLWLVLVVSKFVVLTWRNSSSATRSSWAASSQSPCSSSS